MSWKSSSYFPTFKVIRLRCGVMDMIVVQFRYNEHQHTYNWGLRQNKFLCLLLIVYQTYRLVHVHRRTRTWKARHIFEASSLPYE